MPKEFRVFEVDKYENRFFVCRHSSLESARFWIKREGGDLDEGAKFIVEDETGTVH